MTTTFAVWAKHAGNPNAAACLLVMPTYRTMCNQDWNPMVSPHVEHPAYYQPVVVSNPSGRCFTCLVKSWTFAQQGSLCILVGLTDVESGP